MKRVLIALPFFLVIVLTLQNCKPREEDCDDPSNPKCSNYDPCFGKKETSAAFHMYEAPSFDDFPEWWPKIDSDTVVGRYLRFSALQNGAKEYQWWIGSEATPRFGRDIEVDFTGVSVPKRIRLIVKSNPDNNCFPNDDGIDTVDRMLYFIEDFCNNYPLQGKWEGAFDDKPDSTFTFEYINCRLRGSLSTAPFFSGFDDTLWHFANTGLLTYRQKRINIAASWTDTNTGVFTQASKVVRGAFCTLSENLDSVTIVVEYKDTPVISPRTPFNNPLNRTFRGKRIK